MTTLLPRRALAACALAAAFLTAPADAQRLAPGAPIVGAEQNAALRYWRAFSMMDRERLIPLGDASLTMADPRFEPSPELTAIVAESGAVIEELLRAAALPACDFAVDRDLGPGALLPHLQPMRNACALLLVDARIRLDGADEQGAAERIAGAFRLASHAASEEFIISSLVSVSMFASAKKVTERLLDNGDLGAESRATIRGALGAFDPADPFRARAALWGEAETMVGWLRETIKTPSGRDTVRGLLDGESLASPSYAAISAMDDATLQSHVDLMRAAYAQLLAAWGAPDAQTALRRVNQEITAGAFGEFSRLLLPALDRYHLNVEKAHADFAALRDRLVE